MIGDNKKGKLVMKVSQLGQVVLHPERQPVGALAAPYAEHLLEMNELVITTVAPLNVTC